MKRLLASAVLSMLLGSAALAADSASDPSAPPGTPSAPEPIATKLEPRQYVLFFEQGQIGLPESADTLLPQIVEIYKRVHFTKIRVECHTDKMKTPEKEIALSTDRANRIKAILVLDGVPADAIDAAGLGAAPLLPGKTPDVATSNRRCQIDLS